MATFNGRETFLICFCLIIYISKTMSSQANLINFGGSADDSNQASYYLTAENQNSDSQPNEELKRTQRSFWKKLFKHGWFGEDDCNTCSYHAGDGNDYNNQPNDQSFPAFQPFRNMQQWRPFQPLFRTNCQRRRYQDCNYNYGQDTSSYNANPSVSPTYPEGSALTSNSYADNEGEVQDGRPYAGPESPPPTVNEEPAVNSVATDSAYEALSDMPDKNKENNVYSQPSYSKGENKLPPKIPQILYQPIIYVSPQIKECGLMKQNMENGNSYQQTQVNKGDTGVLPNYVNDELNYNKASDGGNIVGHTNPSYSSNSYMGRSPNSAACTTPTVSTVSTVYTVITPSKPNPQQAGPSKYSLFPQGPLESVAYGENPAVSLSRPLTPLTTSQPYSIPLVMTMDDQPYRVCPELFDEYRRHLGRSMTNVPPRVFPNAGSTPTVPYGSPHYTGNVPSSPLGSQNQSGKTFINAQLVNY